MNALSACCHREVVSQQVIFYPADWLEQSKVIKVDVCTCCGMEVKDYIKEVKEDENQ